MSLGSSLKVEQRVTVNNVSTMGIQATPASDGLPSTSEARPFVAEGGGCADVSEEDGWLHALVYAVPPCDIY